MQTKEIIARVIEYAARLWPGQELKWSLENIYSLSLNYKSNVNVDTIRRTLNLLTAEGRTFTVGRIGSISRNVDGGYTIHTDSEPSAPLVNESTDPTRQILLIFTNKTQSLQMGAKLTMSDIDMLIESLQRAKRDSDIKNVSITQVD